MSEKSREALLNGRAAKAWSRRALENMRTERGSINDINVFPVADGDTGTNLYTTLLSAHRAVERLPGTAAMPEVLSAMATGALRGARGNSGLILSVALQGCADALQSVSVADPDSLAAALELAASRARQAVADPVDGTMLTVLDDMAAMARSQARSGAGLKDLMVAVRRTAQKSLLKTTEQLDVLFKAQVVDAGGTGILELLDALYVVVTGTFPDEAPATGLGEGDAEGDIDSGATPKASRAVQASRAPPEPSTAASASRGPATMDALRRVWRSLPTSIRATSTDRWSASRSALRNWAAPRSCCRCTATSRGCTPTCPPMPKHSTCWASWAPRIRSGGCGWRTSKRRRPRRRTRPS